MGATARLFATIHQIVDAKRDGKVTPCVTCVYAVGNPHLGYSDSRHIMCRRFGKNLSAIGQYTHGPDAPQQFIVRIGSDHGKNVLTPYPIAQTILKDNKCEEHRKCGSLALITRPFARGRSGRSRQP